MTKPAELPGVSTGALPCSVHSTVQRRATRGGTGGTGAPELQEDAASIMTLPDVGHVPMLDDPELVARTILAVTGAAQG